MNVAQYLTEMKNLQEDLLKYFDNGTNLDNLIKLIKDQFQRNQIEEIKATLRLILEIVNNHVRPPAFYTKIEKLLNNFKKEIEQIFTNFELFDFFKSSKILLLYFIKESLITFDRSILQVINNNKYWDSNYIKFFLPESRPFISEKLYQEIEEDILNEGSESFDEKRMIGENEQQICHLIRNDLIDDFIVFISQTNIPLSTIIKKSIFETNDFLDQNNPSLIEYSAFFGSIQIFKYLQLNKVELTPSLWIFAIHGNNPEIIQIIQDNEIEPNFKSYIECLKYAIKFYSNDMADYIYNNFCENHEIVPLNLIYYNYYFFQTDHLEDTLFYSCKYNYIYLVNLIIKTTDIDVNKYIVLKKNEFM